MVLIRLAVCWQAMNINGEITVLWFQETGNEQNGFNRVKSGKLYRFVLNCPLDK